MELSRLSSYHACILQAQAYRALREFMVIQLQRHGMTMMEWALLGVVYDAGDSGITHTKIAELIDVGLPMVTHMVDRVVAEGLVERRPSAEDRRKKLVFVTEKGSHVIDQTEKDIRLALREWMSDIPREDIEVYVKVMAVLAKLPLLDPQSEEPA